jgi:5'-nucleotidase / UDP-sugar diphosphatase
MGNLVADAMLDRVKDQGVTIAIQNGGGLRASIEAGEVTMGDMLAVLPFQNTLDLQLTGADVVAALENGVSAGRGGRRPLPAGRRAALHLGPGRRARQPHRRGAGRGGRRLGADRPGE